MDRTDLERLEEIRDELKDLIDEAGRLVRQSGDRFAWDQARSYWYPHLLTAIDKDNDYLGGSMITMQDTIQKLGGSVDEDEEEDEDWSETESEGEAA